MSEASSDDGTDDSFSTVATGLRGTSTMIAHELKPVLQARLSSSAMLNNNNNNDGASTVISPDDSISRVGLSQSPMPLGGRVSLGSLGANDVCHLLRSVDLGRYADDFAALPWRGADLEAADETDLEECGVRAAVHRKSLLRQVEEWRSSGVPVHCIRPDQCMSPPSASLEDHENNMYNYSACGSSVTLLTHRHGTNTSTSGGSAYTASSISPVSHPTIDDFGCRHEQEEQEDDDEKDADEEMLLEASGAHAVDDEDYLLQRHMHLQLERAALRSVSEAKQAATLAAERSQAARRAVEADGRWQDEAEAEALRIALDEARSQFAAAKETMRLSERELFDLSRHAMKAVADKHALAFACLVALAFCAVFAFSLATRHWRAGGDDGAGGPGGGFGNGTRTASSRHADDAVSSCAACVTSPFAALVSQVIVRAPLLWRQVAVGITTPVMRGFVPRSAEHHPAPLCDFAGGIARRNAGKCRA